MDGWLRVPLVGMIVMGMETYEVYLGEVLEL